MIIFFSLHYYPVLTLQFPTTLMSHRLPTLSSNSQMLAPITTTLDHLPFFIQVPYLKFLVHHTIVSFSLSLHSSDPPSGFCIFPKFLPACSPCKFPPLNNFPVSSGQAIETCCKQWPKQTRNRSLQQERSRKPSPRPGGKGLKEDMAGLEMGLPRRQKDPESLTWKKRKGKRK